MDFLTSECQRRGIKVSSDAKKEDVLGLLKDFNPPSFETTDDKSTHSSDGESVLPIIIKQLSLQSNALITLMKQKSPQSNLHKTLDSVDGTHIDEYFNIFDRIADYGRTYLSVKKVLLDRFACTPEHYRCQFRALKKHQVETFLEFSYRLNNLLIKWLAPPDDLLSKNSFQNILNTLCIEQFFISVPPDLKVLVMDRGCATVAEAARLVDCYALNRQAVAAKATLQDGTTTGSTSRFINTRTADGQIICYHCQLPGHAARFCPSRAVKAKTQYTPQITAISDLNLFDNEPEQGNCQITVSLDLAPELREEGVSCKPGLKLCRSCSKFWSKREENVETEMEVEGAEDPEFEGETISKKEKLDTFLTAIGISPLKLHGIAQHQRLATAKSKLGRAYTQIGDGNGNVDIEVKNQIVLGCTSTLLRKKALQKSMELSDLMKLGKAIELSETQVGVMENYSSSSNPALKVSTGKHCFKCGGDYPHKGELSQPKRENVTIIPGDGDIKNFLQPFTVV
ncbi:hypothetical protein GQR58_014615 [Nymphon striatum]|nr:hypothetical protein GQR58_014615 [Nymphon striatum]